MIPKYIFALLLISFFTQAKAAIKNPHTGMNAERLSPLIQNTRFSGEVGFDSSSFFYRSESRGTASTTVNATIRAKKDTTLLHTKGDLSTYTFVSSQPSIGVESQELYTETQKGLLSDFTLTLGRKIETWSKLDGTWQMMSLWSPRWTWDEIHPQVIGMTGLFLSYNTPRFKALAFVSPFAIPERGTPTEEKDHNIVSSNPFWKPLPTTLNVLGAPTQIQYSLLMPPLESILLRPNFAVKARYDFESGAFVNLNSGVLPVHMVQLAAEPYISTSGSSGVLNVNIRPQFPMRNINTIELGFDSPAKDWNLWLSGSYEQPFHFENGDTWLNPIITPSSIVSAGTSLQASPNLRLEASALFINEEPFQRSSKVPNVNVQLPSRFPLKQGIKFGGNWHFSDLTQGNLDWVQDLIQKNHLVSMNVSHWLRSIDLTVGAGMDLIVASSTQGWVGQFYGDDRLRGWLKYAF